MIALGTKFQQDLPYSNWMFVIMKWVLIQLSQNRKQKINANLHGRNWRQKTNHDCLQRLQRNQNILIDAHFQELGTGKWFLFTFPVEIIAGVFGTLVKDSSNPHTHVSREQTVFVAWYICSHSVNWSNNYTNTTCNFRI